LRYLETYQPAVAAMHWNHLRHYFLPVTYFIKHYNGSA